MRVLLRFRRAKLGAPVVGQDLGQDVRQRERREGLGNGERLVILRHGGATDRRPAAGVEAGEAIHAQCGDDLAHPVAPVVEEEDPVAILDRGDRQPVAVMYERPHELVGFAALVRRLHREDGMLRGDADAMRDGVVRRPGAVPPLVAVHPVVPPSERSDVDAAARNAPHVEQQRAHHLGAERGRGVASVEESMDRDVRHLEPHAELDAGEQVAVERVHAAGAEQPDQVKRAAGLPEPGAELLQHRQAGRTRPRSMLCEMRTRSCGTTRPAPRLRWPTSLLPIWPTGSPTASSLASSSVRG